MTAYNKLVPRERGQKDRPNVRAAKQRAGFPRLCGSQSSRLEGVGFMNTKQKDFLKNLSRTCAAYGWTMGLDTSYVFEVERR